MAVLNELQTQRGGARRSAYREILYLVLVAFGKDTSKFYCNLNASIMCSF